MSAPTVDRDRHFLKKALRLAERATGRTSPNPLVGAVLVKQDRIIGQGWHHQAGHPHAEIEALNDARRRGLSPRGATLYVTLEPCCTHGRTPPCTDAILAAGIRRVVVAVEDPNPAHAGRGIRRLRRAGIAVATNVLPAPAARVNESFFHWIVHRTPFVTLKAAMTLDGKIATTASESKWITGEPARALGMRLREAADAILVGVNTVLTDNPSLTFRGRTRRGAPTKLLRRIILDSRARLPLTSHVIQDPSPTAPTTVVVTRAAPRKRVEALREHVQVWVAPTKAGRVHLPWLLQKLGHESVTQLLVEGGGEVHGSFLQVGLAHRVAFFYAPKIVGGTAARRATGGAGAQKWPEIWRLVEPEWKRCGEDLWVTARLDKGGRPRNR